ncbi:T9SS type A sorting domain-containing protein [Flavobacterium jejuense]|uniref:T9SS type A sorting domain-containing protein n=1 Tax=Flavobacterium jejuense TaxID=1544455 RepID=A0ABX0ISK4_9FLAO|nr:choice-of-anchor J domain-containing protein [Flavobacterium jejuense]NHN26819.1 T9SS type A sorting domain-containing protein [Flavobacterium jejuense]
MKKTLLLLLMLVSFFSQSQETQYFPALVNNGSTSANSRAPQGSQRYARTVYLITAAEVMASGLVNGDIVNSIGFNYSSAQNIATTGNFIVYMQNTTDATNLKSATWATAITGMTTVSNATFTIPTTTGEVYHQYSGGSSFTYTGGALYVAFDYQNATGTLATTSNLALCNTTLTNGLKSAQSTTAIPTTMTNSNWRPQTFLGKDVICASPSAVTASLITDNSASISWIGSGSNFSIQYGVQGFTLGTGTIVNSISSPYNISMLNTATSYSYYIKKICASPNESIWSGPYSFTTSAFSAAIPPYSYGFETSDDWSLLNAGTGNNWTIYVQGAPIPTAAEGTSYAGYNYNSSNAANAWLFSRRLNLTAGTNYSIKFKYRIADGTVYPENFKVTMGTDKTVVAQTNTLQTYNSVPLQAWTQADLSFTPSTSGDYYLGFNCFSLADQYRLAIDDVEITAAVLSTSTFDAKFFKVYPNPVNNMVSISSGSKVTFDTISITDINGRIVKSFTYNAVTETNINVSDLNSGIYFLKIKTSEGILDKKIIKQQ